MGFSLNDMLSWIWNTKLSTDLKKSIEPSIAGGVGGLVHLCYLFITYC